MNKLKSIIAFIIPIIVAISCSKDANNVPLTTDDLTCSTGYRLKEHQSVTNYTFFYDNQNGLLINSSGEKFKYECK